MREIPPLPWRLSRFGLRGDARCGSRSVPQFHSGGPIGQSVELTTGPGRDPRGNAKIPGGGECAGTSEGRTCFALSILEMLSGILQNSLGHTLLKRLLSKNGGGEAGANTPELISMPDEDS